MNQDQTAPDTVNVELVGAATYSTLSTQYRKGDVYTLTAERAEAMLALDNPINGARLFQATDKEAQLNSRNAPVMAPSSQELAMGERDTGAESGNGEGDEAQSTAARSEQAEHKGPRKLVSGGPRNANLKAAVKPSDAVSV